MQGKERKIKNRNEINICSMKESLRINILRKSLRYKTNEESPAKTINEIKETLLSE